MPIYAVHRSTNAAPNELVTVPAWNNGPLTPEKERDMDMDAISIILWMRGGIPGGTYDRVVEMLSGERIPTENLRTRYRLLKDGMVSQVETETEPEWTEF